MMSFVMPVGNELSAAAKSAWALLTRLGEAQILLPAMLAVLLWLVLSARAKPAALWWLAATGVAAVITTFTKVAFFGFEVGYAPLNYTGISGHAMFAAAVLPVLALVAAGGKSAIGRRAAVAGGYILAGLIAYSRVRVGSHSTVEAVAGMALGSAASAVAMYSTHFPQLRVPPWLAVGLLLWMLSLPLGAPPSKTHDWVVRLSLVVSERHTPYSRWKMHRDYRREQQRQLSAQLSVPAGPTLR